MRKIALKIKYRPFAKINKPRVIIIITAKKPTKRERVRKRERERERERESWAIQLS